MAQGKRYTDFNLRGEGKGKLYIKFRGLRILASFDAVEDARVQFGRLPGVDRELIPACKGNCVKVNSRTTFRKTRAFRNTRASTSGEQHPGSLVSNSAKTNAWCHMVRLHWLWILMAREYPTLFLAFRSETLFQATLPTKSVFGPLVHSTRVGWLFGIDIHVIKELVDGNLVARQHLCVGALLGTC
jgi:hypothetical protein